MLSDHMKEYIQQLFEQSLKLIENSDTLSEAIDKLRLILKVDPNHPEATYNLGRALTLTGKQEEGLEYLKKAREFGFDGKEIHSLLTPISPDEVTDLRQKKDSLKNRLLSLPSRERIVFLTLFIMISYFSRNFLTNGYLLGWDSMSHVFKTWFTMESILGRSSFDWCEYWYQGSPIMPMYAPLFYASSALFAILTRLNALEASKWIVFLSYPLSSLSFYYYTRRNQVDVASIAGSILYGLIPWHFTYVTVLGNPTYTLCYMFLPPLFKYVKGDTQKDFILSSVAFSLTILSHQGTGFLVAYALVWYHLFTGIINRTIRKALVKLVLLGALSTGLLSFFWIPYLYYSRITSSFQVPFQPVHEVVGQLLQPGHFMYLGSSILLILIASTILILISRDKEGLVFTLLTLLLFIITFGYWDPTVKIIYPFTRIIGPGYRFNILISFTIAMVLTIALKEVPGILEKYIIFEKKRTQLQYILLIVTTILTVSAFLPISNFYNMKIPESHNTIYSVLSHEDGNVRAWWVPRGALGACLPMFTGLPTPDGWYDQGAYPENVALIHDLADIQLKEKPEYFVEQLGALSIKYLVVTGSQLYVPLKTNEKLELVEERQDVALFRVKDIDQLTVNPKPSSVGLYRMIGMLVTVTVVVGIIYFNMDTIKGILIIRNLVRVVILIGTFLGTYLALMPENRIKYRH